MRIVNGPSNLTPTEKNLMVSLAYFDGIKCNPSHAKLSDETGIPRREIIRHLTAIKDKGYLTWKRGQRASTYTIFYDRFAVGESPTYGSVSDVGKSPTSAGNSDVGKSLNSDVGKSPTQTGIEPELSIPLVFPLQRGKRSRRRKQGTLDVTADAVMELLNDNENEE